MIQIPTPFQVAVQMCKDIGISTDSPSYGDVFAMAYNEARYQQEAEEWRNQRSAADVRVLQAEAAQGELLKREARPA